MAFDLDEGFILDLSDDSITPISSPMRSYSDCEDDDYSTKIMMPEPETDPEKEVIFYFREPTQIEKTVDGQVIYHYDPMLGLVGKAMADEIAAANAKMRPSFMVIPSGMSRKDITMEQFKYALKVYENNQSMSLHNLDYLNSLEDWFVQILEPKPVPRWKGPLRGTEILEYNQDIEDWIQREMTKLKGYSCFCDHDVRKVVKIKSETKTFIKDHINRLIAMKNTGKFSHRR
jgi:hypothetical protein